MQYFSFNYRVKNKEIRHSKLSTGEVNNIILLLSEKQLLSFTAERIFNCESVVKMTSYLKLVLSKIFIEKIKSKLKKKKTIFRVIFMLKIFNLKINKL